MTNNKIMDAIIEQYGFPLYLYEEEIIQKKVTVLKEALPDFTLYYSIKTNPNKNVCHFMSSKGLGADAASANEVVKAQETGFNDTDIMYSSPGKTTEDIMNTLDKAVIVADSYSELAMINDICAKQGRQAAVGLRINPNFYLNMNPTPGILAGVPSKFGVDEESLILNKSFIDSLNYIKVTGIHVYLRSQIVDEGALYKYFDKVFDIAEFCTTEMKWCLSFINFGGGFGVPYTKSDKTIDWEELQPRIRALVKRKKAIHKENVRLIVESGRFVL